MPTGDRWTPSPGSTASGRCCTRGDARRRSQRLGEPRHPCVPGRPLRRSQPVPSVVRPPARPPVDRPRSHGSMTLTSAAALDAHPHRWPMLLLLAAAELLGMSLWFAASAVAPELQRQWGLTASQTGWLTAAVQAGFVAGTAAAAILNLADVIPSRWYFAVSATLGAVVNVALLAAPTYPLALVSRFFTGFCLAGVYPPAMKMIATWFSSGRGLAIGTVVGALTVGKAVPYLAHALAGSRVAPVVVVVSGGALVGAVLVAAGYRDAGATVAPGDGWLSGAHVGAVQLLDVDHGLCRSERCGARPRGWRRALGGGARSAGVRSHRRGGIGVRVGWLGCGSDRARAARDSGHGSERQLRRRHRRLVRVERLGHGRRRVAVGVLRHRRFGAVQHDGHEIGAVARGRHCADPADVARIPADDGEHSARSAARRLGRLAVGVRRTSDRPGLGYRVDSAAPGGEGGGGRGAALRHYEDPNVAAVVVGRPRRAGRYDPRAAVNTYVDPMHAARHRQRDLPRAGAGAAQRDRLPIGEVSSDLHQRCAGDAHDEPHRPIAVGVHLEPGRRQDACSIRAAGVWHHGVAGEGVARRNGAHAQRDGEIAADDAAADRIGRVAAA